MAMIDVIQTNRKYKNPYLRVWFHEKKGDDTYMQIRMTQKNLLLALIKMVWKPEQTFWVAVDGKEYELIEYIRGPLRKQIKLKTKTR